MGRTDRGAACGRPARTRLVAVVLGLRLPVAVAEPYPVTEPPAAGQRSQAAGRPAAPAPAAWRCGCRVRTVARSARRASTDAARGSGCHPGPATDRPGARPESSPGHPGRPGHAGTPAPG